MKGIYMPRQTYRTEKVVLENGLLILDALPFQSQDVVEVIVRLRENRKIPKDRYPMRGKILRYDDPTEPVAQDDWDVLK